VSVAPLRVHRRGRIDGAPRLAIACLVWLGGVSSAFAYSTPALYTSDPWRTGGAGGRSFTGSPADGYTCNACHLGETRQRALRGGPVGGYEPGATYDLEIAWPGEQVGLTVEATDLQGIALGRLVSPPLDLLEEDELCLGGAPAAEVLELVDGRTPLGVSECGATRLRLQWTAPTEPVEGSIFLSMVLADGDGTPAGDATSVIEVPLTPRGADGQCSLAADGGAKDRDHVWSALVLFFLVGVALRRRRSPRMRSRLLLLAPTLPLVAGGSAGCARVQPYERGRLAQPDMQIADDGDLKGGSEHALDYREGSAGGVGGNGGGCGCN